MVQPVREALVLCAQPKLETSSQQPGQVDQRKRHQGHRRERDVDHLNGHLVEDALPRLHEGVEDVVEEVVQVEDEEEAEGAEDREAPRGKQVEGEVFDGPGRGEEAHVNGDEAHLSAELRDGALGSAAVAAQKYLGRRTNVQPHPSVLRADQN